MKDGVRIVNVRPRPADRSTRTSQAALDSGKVGGAALDVFPQRAVHRAPALRTATTSSSRRTSAPRPPRRRTAPAFQPPSRSSRRSPAACVTTAVNIAAVARRGHGGARRRSCRSASSSAGSPQALGRAARSTASRSSSSAASPTTTRRPLAIAVLLGDPLRPHRGARSTWSTRRRSPRSAASTLSETTRTSARDFTELVRVTVVSGGDAARGRRHDARPPQPPAPARGLGPALLPASSRTTWRSSATRDRPGMIGRVGTIFGEHGVNIDSAAVGYEPDEDDRRVDGEAVMVVTTHDAIPEALDRRDHRDRRLHRRPRRQPGLTPLSSARPRAARQSGACGPTGHGP